MSNIYSDNIHKNFVDSKKAVALPRYIGYDPRTRAIIIIDSIDMAKKIFIDAGHSRKLGDVGAVSDGFIEFDINSTVAKNMQTVLLRDYDCEVIVDYDSAIGANCRTAVDRGCSAFISTHENAGGGDGAEVYYYSTDAKAKALAQSILTEITNIGQNSRGIKGGDKFGMCSTLKNIIPTVLVEGFFVV